MLFFSACTPAGESIDASSGDISSPNFPNNYDANRICTWNITVPSTKIIKLTFLNFTLVAGENDDCAGAAADSARVFITNVASHGGKPNDFKICGQKLPPPVYSEGNFIQVRFESRTGLVNKGFNATFEAIDGDSRKSFFFRGSLWRKYRNVLSMYPIELSENYVEYNLKIMR